MRFATLSLALFLFCVFVTALSAGRAPCPLAMVWLSDGKGAARSGVAGFARTCGHVSTPLIKTVSVGKRGDTATLVSRLFESSFSMGAL